MSIPLITAGPAAECSKVKALAVPAALACGHHLIELLALIALIAANRRVG